MGARMGFAGGEGAVAYDKGPQVDLGSVGSSIIAELNESERHYADTSHITGAGLPVHKYPINLESSDSSQSIQECIHFTAIKQGGISFAGDEYKKNLQEQKDLRNQKVIDRTHATWMEGTGEGATQKQLEEHKAMTAIFYNDNGEKRSRPDQAAIDGQHTTVDKIVPHLYAQKENMTATAKPLEHCFLYMPTAVTYAEGAEWGVEQLGALGNLVKQGLTGKSGSIGDMLKNFGGGAAGDIAKAAATTAGAIAGKALGGGLAGAAAGFVLGTELGQGIKSAGRFTTNPYEEQMFNGIPFRNFSFDFTFTPSSEDEGKQVFRIIKMFRKHSRPGYVAGLAGEGLFSYPNEFNIQFMKMDGSGLVENKILPKIHNCVCTNVTTNFTPEGFWVALRDGNPISTTLSLTFNETVKITQDKVEEGY